LAGQALAAPAAVPFCPWCPPPTAAEAWPPTAALPLPPPTQVAATSDEKLNQPLLRFHEDATPELPLLTLNFDPALVRLLRETKYFLLLKVRGGQGCQPRYAQSRSCCPPHDLAPVRKATPARLPACLPSSARLPAPKRLGHRGL